MADEKRQVSLAIGVGNAKPLPYLGGAINGAEAFQDWALALGYEAKILTDAEDPVTIARLRTELVFILTSGDRPIHRLLLYFAGHGLIREAEEGLWLLSDWNAEMRAVAVEGLKRRLYMHGIRQIAIFADCCRSLAMRMDAADLTPDSVLGRGPKQMAQPAIDKFIAAQDGTATFMVPGPTPSEDRCLFSGVLMEGLWGTKPSAFSTLPELGDKITSRSLGSYLQIEVPQLAKRYKRELMPNVNTNFPEKDDIYFGEGTAPKPPHFPDWPTPEAVETLGISSYSDDNFSEGNVPFVLRTGKATADELRSQIEQVPSEKERSTGASLLDKLRLQSRPHAFETRSGFAVQGTALRTVWTSANVFAEIHGESGWWRIGSRDGYVLQRPAPVLLEFEDGRFAAVVALPRFIGAMLVDQRGATALVYREIYSEREDAAGAEEAIAQMESGSLRANNVIDLAVQLRRDKHVDPMLGVISAYLYDSIGDVESIRRMAYYYVQNNQAIPYDIALLAQVDGKWSDGTFSADIPAVPACKARTEAEDRYNWTHSRTPETKGVVGGLWPWMRQGWFLLDDHGDQETTLILRGLQDLARNLIPGRFTTLDSPGGKELARICNLQFR